MYLFFDTETNGFPPKARMTQLAFLLTDRYGAPIKEYETIIKPDGWTVPKEKFFIENNISTERCLREGIPCNEALKEMEDGLIHAERKIAHNIQFDDKILDKEISTYYKNKSDSLFYQTKGYCTMKTTTDLCRIPGRYGKFKWPKLEELHMHLFGCNFEGAHDAMFDVKAMAKCFFELKNRGLVKI